MKKNEAMDIDVLQSLILDQVSDRILKIDKPQVSRIPSSDTAKIRLDYELPESNLEARLLFWITTQLTELYLDGDVNNIDDPLLRVLNGYRKGYTGVPEVGELQVYKGSKNGDSLLEVVVYLRVKKLVKPKIADTHERWDGLGVQQYHWDGFALNTL